MRTSIIAGFTLFAAMGAGHGAVFAKKPVDTTRQASDREGRNRQTC
jgi:hypothetical protein